MRRFGAVELHQHAHRLRAQALARLLRRAWQALHEGLQRRKLLRDLLQTIG